jgi:hypothetical protein
MKIHAVVVFLLAFFYVIPSITIASPEINQQVVAQPVTKVVTVPVRLQPIVPAPLVIESPLPQTDCAVVGQHGIDPLDSVARINLHDGGTCYSSLHFATARVSNESLAVVQTPTPHIRTVITVLPTWQKHLAMHQGAVPVQSEVTVILSTGFLSSMPKQGDEPVYISIEKRNDYTDLYSIEASLSFVMRC